MTLQYLDFDYSEDANGLGTFDAMAHVGPSQVAALYAEVTQVLDWAHAQFPARPGPDEDDAEWQYDLQASQETSTPLTLRFDAETGQLAVSAQAPGAPRTTVSLSVSGPPWFCSALREAFDLP